MAADASGPAPLAVARRAVPHPPPSARLPARGGAHGAFARARGEIAERLRPHVGPMTPDEFDALVEAVLFEGARMGAAWAEE